MSRRPGAAALLLTAVLALAGCSSAPIDPALTSAVAAAISSGASAQLGLELDDKGGILPGTLTALLGDMADNLSGTEKELEMHQAADAADAEYRAQALSGVRASLEAVHVAQGGDPSAGLDALTASVEDLRALEKTG
ncbi:hypothetical protein [Microbacterium deminutum]|uniref:Uncharacterized protein n=1 Tax=Microbacterium deminutum TaxID=344164 RepID=A0ABP5CC91_9MICO